MASESSLAVFYRRRVTRKISLFQIVIEDLREGLFPIENLKKLDLSIEECFEFYNQSGPDEQELKNEAAKLLATLITSDPLNTMIGQIELHCPRQGPIWSALQATAWIRIDENLNRKVA